MANTKIPVELSSTPGIVDNSNATAITIDSSENVGISTTSPSEKLSTVGNVNIGNNDSSNPFSYLRLGATQYGAADIKPENYNFHRVGLSFHVDNTADDTINPTEAMRIDNSGNVGIGTTSPASGVGSPLTLTSTSTGYVGLRLNGTGSYTNDWDLYASGDGAGLDYFGIYDRTNTAYRMVVTNTGNVGIGTTSPQRQLHVLKNANNTHIAIERDGTDNPSALILGANQNRTEIISSAAEESTSGVPLTFLTGNTERMRIDSSGKAIFKGVIENELYSTFLSAGASSTVSGYVGRASSVVFSGTATDLGVGGGAGNLIFAAGGATERMRIDSSGNLLVGTTSAVAGNECAISGRGTATSLVTLSPNTSYSQAIISNGDNLVFFGRGVEGAVSQVGSIKCDSSSTSYNTSSDYRLKENVDYSWDATTKLKQLKPARFNFIADADTTVDGFLAHEVASVVPEAISGTKDEVDSDGNPVYQGIDQSKLVPLLVKTIQELEERITALES